MSGHEKRTDIQIPSWITVLHGVIILSGFTAYCGMAYMLVRPVFGSFGFDLGITLRSMVVVTLLGCFIFFLIPLVDLPLIWFHHQRRLKRHRRGCCPDCGYPDKVGIPGKICPECGSELVPPKAWRPGAGTVRRFLILLVMAILLGSAVGELSLLMDESTFQVLATARRYVEPGDSYSRARIWPNGHADMTYTPENGSSGSKFMESTRMHRWERDGD